jgi:hypothetical protein
VGTNIDCSASSTDDGQFKLEIMIEDSSVSADDQAAQDTSRPRGVPVFRTFRSSNTLILKDGQSTQFTTATDKISGGVVRAHVTLNVVK